MLDVLIYLFEHCVDEGRAASRDEAVLRSMLRDAGFDQSDIHKAFIWLEDLSRHEEPATTHLTTGFRVFSTHERRKLSRACRGYLTSLDQSGILSPTAREQIIERALALDLDELDLEQLKLIIMIVLAHQPGDETLHGWLEALFLDGSAAPMQ